MCALKEKSQCFEADVAPLDIHQGLLQEEEEFIEKEMDENERQLTSDDLKELE